MQGNAFLGKNVRPPAKYAYSFRDRMDERYDMQRSVRSKDFKYIRYYEAYKPFTQYMNTPEEGEIMKAIRFAHEKGTLPPAAEHMMLSNKPPEELFDLKNDPWELNNLANEPEYKGKLLEMRNAHAVWSDETKDTGLIPETIMRTWEKESGKSIYELLRQKEIPIDEIRTAALSKNRKELLEALNHKNEAVRYWAAISLGNLTFDKKKLKVLGKSLQDPIPAVRIAAARAICNSVCSEKSIEVLKNEIQSQDEWTRLLTAQVLDEIDEKAKPLESQLQKAIAKNDTNKYVIRVANRALNELNKTNNVVD
jgi:N-sulfoglucosamine sulfohydrolase